MHPRHGEQDRGPFSPKPLDRELRSRYAEAKCACHVVGSTLTGVGDDPGAAVGPGQVHGPGIGGAYAEPAVIREGPAEALEGGLVVRHVVIDVGMVELEAREERRPGPVVEELGALVEVGGVVLVALDHHVRPGAEAEVPAVVEGHPADQERRVEPCGRQHVPHERRRGRLAVRPGDDDAVPARCHQGAEGGGKAHLRDAALQHGGRLGVHPPDDVSDDHQVGPCPVEVLRPVGNEHLDAPRAKHVAHGRVDILVAPGDGVAGGLEHPGEGAHAGAGHAHQVDPLHRAGGDVGEDVAVGSVRHVAVSRRRCRR